MILGMTLTSFLILLFLIAVGIYDIYRIATKKKTISQKIQAWTQSRWVDGAIMVGILVLVWWVFTPMVFIPVLIGCLLGHWFWNEK